MTVAGARGQRVLNLFAGPGGWCEALSTRAVQHFGIELDEQTCATRYAAGHATWQADVSAIDPTPLVGLIDGLIASPPCPDWSIAGKQRRMEGESGHLVLEVLRWVGTLRPRWIACEQVPPALVMWRGFEDDLQAWGYSTWSGVLNAADYGVPQTRERAILIAHLERPVAAPLATHAEFPEHDLFGDIKQPWITMADALGWGATERPYVTLAGGTKGGPCYDFTGGSGVRRTMLRERERGAWVWKKPATTVTGDPRISARCHHEHGEQLAGAKTTDQILAGDYNGREPIRLTIDEALTLQGFRADYPLQGTKTSKHMQIGNAVPPPLANAVLGSVMDDERMEVAA